MSRAIRREDVGNIEWSEISDSETLNVGNIAPLSGRLTIGGSAGQTEVYVNNGHDFQVWGAGAELRTDGGASLKVQGSGTLEVPATGAHRIYGGTLSIEIPSSFTDQAVFEAPNTTNPKAIVKASGGEPANTILFQTQNSGGGNLLSIDVEGDLVLAGTATIGGAYTLPAVDGNPGQQLQTNGAGAVSWENPGGGGVYIYAPAASNPTSPIPNDGDIYFNTTFSSWQYYDSGRTKWLSITEFPFAWGHDYTDGTYLRGGGLITPGTGTGILIPRDATIKRISARSLSGDATKQFDILVNGTVASSFALTANLYKNNAVSIDVSEDDYVWVQSSSIGTAAVDVSVIFWVSWRTT
jgi:hypothetical protein